MSLVQVQSREPNFHSSLVQSVERRTVNPYVAGSSPAGGARFDDGVVQAVERRTVNPYVAGSSPAGGAKFAEGMPLASLLCFVSRLSSCPAYFFFSLAS